MTRFPRTALLALLFSASLPVQAAGPTGLLNDTGQASCYDGTTLVPCTTTNSDDAATWPRQDGRYGRDAANRDNVLTKTGAGLKGFDYTKVCFNGNLEGGGTCTGTLVANTTATATGTPATDWACTKDNVTNLIWSLHSGVRGEWTTYANITLPAATNNATRCGYNTGWRLPTRRELLSIVHLGARNPAINNAYFPGTQPTWYWSADADASVPTRAWHVDFFNGDSDPFDKTDPTFVRLVRNGQ